MGVHLNGKISAICVNFQRAAKCALNALTETQSSVHIHKDRKGRNKNGFTVCFGVSTSAFLILRGKIFARPFSHTKQIQ